MAITGAAGSTEAATCSGGPTITVGAKVVMRFETLVLASKRGCVMVKCFEPFARSPHNFKFSDCST